MILPHGPTPKLVCSGRGPRDRDRPNQAYHSSVKAPARQGHSRTDASSVRPDIATAASRMEPSAKRCCPLEPPTIPRAGCCRRRVAGSGQRPAQRRSHSQMAVRAMKKATRPPPRHQAKSAASSSIERSEEDERCQHVELCLRMSLDPDRDAKVSVGAWSALGACAVPGVC